MNPSEHQIVDIVASKIGTTPKLSDSLDALGVDSLAMAEIIFEIETQFDIKSDDSLLALSTMQELCDYVAQRSCSSRSIR